MNRSYSLRLPPKNTNLRGSITVLLTSCLFCLDSAALLMLNEQQIYLFGQIQTSQTGVELYRETSFYGECSFLDDYKILAATHSEQFLGFKTVLEALKVWLIFSDFLCPWWSVAKHPNPGPDSNH